MKSIWKFPLDITDCQDVPMPNGSDILAVQTQAGHPCLWAAVETTAPVRRRRIHIVGTGHPMETGDSPYIGTFQVNGGTLVFHVFDGGEKAGGTQ